MFLDMRWALKTQMVGVPGLSWLELKSKTLPVAVKSAHPAIKGQEVTDEAAEGLLRRPLTTIRTVGQMMTEQCSDRPGDEASGISIELAQKVGCDFMDKPYRETLDAPIPALCGKSTRQAVQTSAGQGMTAKQDQSLTMILAGCGPKLGSWNTENEWRVWKLGTRGAVARMQTLRPAG